MTASRSVLAVNPTSMTSGAERVLLDYLVFLQLEGWDVCCASPPGPMQDRATQAGLRWAEIPDLKLASGNKATSGLAMTRAWRRASTALQGLAEDADVVVVNGLMALPALRLARLSCPVTWLVHDVVVRKDLQLLVRGAAGAVTRAITVSECAAEFPRSVGIATTVVLNGTPFPLPRAPITMPTPPTVGVSAVLTPWKGHDVLLEAAAQTPASVRFELMGGIPVKDEDYVASLHARASQPDLAGRVRFLGHVDDPVARLRTWSVAVSPSVEPEACPLNVLEAMSVGVPMVVTDHGGAAELIADAGLRVSPRDADALATGINAALTETEDHRRMRLRGPEIIDERHRIEDVCARFAAALVAVIDGDGNP